MAVGYNIIGFTLREQTNPAGLFDGLRVNEWNTPRVAYWGAAGNYIEIEFDKACDIWRAGTTSWIDSNKRLKLLKWNGTTYDDVTDIYTIAPVRTTELQRSKFIQNLPAGRYRFEYFEGYRTDSEWFLIEAEETLTRPTATYTPAEIQALFPYSEIERVALDSLGNIQGIHSSTNTNNWVDGSLVDWTAYENNGWNCMVKIPKLYYTAKLLYLPNGESIREWGVSKTLIEGFKLHPAFIRDGIEQDFIYVAAFEGSLINNILRSLPNKTVYGSSLAAIRGYARANGAGWESYDYLTSSLVQLLFIIEFADFDSQAKIGNGNASTPQLTGLSLSQGNSSYGDNSYMTYRGIENLWGNYQKWIDGINILNNVPYIADYNFASATETGYSSTEFLMPYGTGTLKDVSISEFSDEGFLPLEIEGTDYALFFHDRVDTSDSGWRQMTTGAISSISELGVFSSDFVASGVGPVPSRLVFLKKGV